MEKKNDGFDELMGTLELELDSAKVLDAEYTYEIASDLVWALTAPTPEYTTYDDEGNEIELDVDAGTVGIRVALGSIAKFLTQDETKRGEVAFFVTWLGIVVLEGINFADETQSRFVEDVLSGEPLTLPEFCDDEVGDYVIALGYELLDLGHNPDQKQLATDFAAKLSDYEILGLADLVSIIYGWLPIFMGGTKEDAEEFTVITMAKAKMKLIELLLERDTDHA